MALLKLKESKNLLFVCIPLLLFGCAKDDFNDPSQDEVPYPNPVSGICFEGSLSEGLDGPKTTLSSDGKVSWNIGDLITINGTTRYAATNEGGTTVFQPLDETVQPEGVFVEPCSPYKAFYACDFEQEGNEYFPVLPKIQTYAAGRISNNPMYAVSSTRHLQFKNICSLVKLSLKGNGLIKSIEVNDQQKYLSGRFAISGDNSAVIDSRYGSHSTILDLGEGVTLTDTPHTFYISLPAGTYSSLQFTFNDSRGKSTSIKLKDGKVETLSRSASYSIVKSAKFINILNGAMPEVGQPLKIYDGKVNHTYMYGPTIFVNKDGSIDTWWASSGGVHSPGDTLWQADDTREANRIATEVTRMFGQYFETDKSFYSVFVKFATYGRKDQQCLMSIYDWKGDVQTTVNSTPIHTVLHATNPLTGRGLDNWWTPIYKNDNLVGGAILKENMFPAGKYFVTIRPADYTRDRDLAVWLHHTKIPSSDRPHKSSCWQGVCTGTNTSGAWGEMTTVQFEAAINSSTPFLDVTFWDQVKYRHSDDGGQTWTEPTVAFQPTYDARDHFAACDPSLVKIGEYYYLTYTGTETNDDYLNNIYLARSKSPVGPWEKWSWNSGNGHWGHYCDPLVSFDGPSNQFGIGEPSMVYKGGKLYFYYQLVQGTSRCTKVTVVDNVANDPQWPLKVYSLHEATQPKHSVAFVQSPGFGQIGSSDSSDIKYCDSDGNFYAVFTYDRFSAASKIALMKSSNGVNFSYVGDIAGPLVPELHNCGMSGTPEGHFSFDKPQYIAYAQGGIDSGNWGAWPSYWHTLYW